MCTTRPCTQLHPVLQLYPEIVPEVEKWKSSTDAQNLSKAVRCPNSRGRSIIRKCKLVCLRLQAMKSLEKIRGRITELTRDHMVKTDYWDNMNAKDAQVALKGASQNHFRNTPGSLVLRPARDPEAFRT